MSYVEHVVTSADSVQSLALRYLGNADRWRDIVDFNNLDYPYLTDDPNFQTQVYALGTITVTRAYTSSSLTVPSGTVFAVPALDNVPARNYMSLQSVTIPAGVTTAQIVVQCTVAGMWGNVPQNEITTIVTSNQTLQSAFSTITNAQDITNGSILNVKKMGDSLLIPVADSWNGTDAYSTLDDYYAAAFGTDIELGDDGDLVFDSYGAIGSVTGTSNLAQAIRDRLMTPRLSLVYHPEYGSLLEQYLTDGVTPYLQKMIALAIMETLYADDRVQDVSVVSANLVGTDLQIVVDVTPLQQGQAVRVPATLPNIPYAA